VNREGILPKTKYSEIKARISVVGPMARSVADVSAMLRVLVNDPEGLRLDEQVDLKKLRYYFLRNEGAQFISSVDKEVSAKVDQAVDFIRSDLGCQVDVLPRIEVLVQAIEFWEAWAEKSCLPRLKTGYDVPAKSWEPVSEFLRCLTGQSDRNIYTVFVAFLDDWTRGDPLRMEKMYEEYEAYKSFMEDLLGDDGILILPGNIGPAPFHHGPLLHTGYFGLAGLINVLRMPSTAVPMGLSSKGLPLGIQIVSNHGNDRLCLAFAREIERKFGGYVPPF